MTAALFQRIADMTSFRPLPGPFGVEAVGVDLAQPLSDATFAELERAFYENHVITLRAQDLTAAQFSAFARRVGPPQPHVIDQFHHPEDANILILSNVKKDGQPTGLRDAGSYFHTDYSYLQVPARATTLYSRVVPKVGGDTLFANQQAAYDDLPQAMKQRIEPLLAIHHYGNRNDVDETSRTVASVLIDEQAAHSTQPKYQLRFAYGVGDIVVWDNAALLHSATLIDPADARTLWRITVLESAPDAAAPAVLAPTFAR